MKNNENAIITIPNILSLTRILLIPFFFIYYLKNKFIIASIIFIASGITDFVDGFIARKFNLVSNFGKILDPFADKLTQGSVALCITIKNTYLIPLVAFFCLKELSMLIGSYVLLRKGKKPTEAKWWGKIGTVIIYCLLILVLISDILPTYIPNWTLYAMMIITAISIIFSFYNYFLIFKKIFYKKEKDIS